VIDILGATGFYFRMTRVLSILGLLALSAAGICSEPSRPLPKANALPLALDDHFQFRKFKTLRIDPDYDKSKSIKNPDALIQFEKDSAYFKTVNSQDRKEREGEYFTFFWKAAVPADLIVRFEYRQEKLGNLVQAREIACPGAKGSMTTKFAILGDDYYDDGRVTAWRALLIEKGRIVGLTQSYLWN
jgi:hypothetical protein